MKHPLHLNTLIVFRIVLIFALVPPSIQIEQVDFTENVDESFFQNGGSNETDVANLIEHKKRELEKLVQDIHSLEINSPASKSPGSKFRSTIPLPEDLYQRGSYIAFIN
jgi:hypothetical protein